MPVEVLGPPVATPRPQIWRITDRATFDALRRRGRRVRQGPLTLTWLAPAPTEAGVPPRIGFAVGKHAGGAVVRNRIRRRLRAVGRELVVAGDLPGGAYLIGANATVATMPWSELVALVRATVAAASR